MAETEQRKRARSEGEKEARRAAILDAARALIAEVGFDGVTMNALAKEAGLAKGTLYLYVKTKEELFLALSVASMKDFVSRLEGEATAENLPEALTRAAVETPLFLPLFARLAAVIEANVDDDPLFAAKRELVLLSARIEALIAALYEVPPECAAAVSEALLLAMQGAAQFDLNAGRDPETLPDDLRPLFARNIFANRFADVAGLILAVAR